MRGKVKASRRALRLQELLKLDVCLWARTSVWVWVCVDERWQMSFAWNRWENVSVSIDKCWRQLCRISSDIIYDEIIAHPFFPCYERDLFQLPQAKKCVRMVSFSEYRILSFGDNSNFSCIAILLLQGSREIFDWGWEELRWTFFYEFFTLAWSASRHKSFTN